MRAWRGVSTWRSCQIGGGRQYLCEEREVTLISLLPPCREGRQVEVRFHSMNALLVVMEEGSNGGFQVTTNAIKNCRLHVVKLLVKCLAQFLKFPVKPFAQLFEVVFSGKCRYILFCNKPCQVFFCRKDLFEEFDVIWGKGCRHTSVA